MLNNLAGLNHSLGNDEIAIAQLREAFAIFVDAHLEVEAGYVLSSLAEIHRERGDLEEAEVVARRALALLEGRIDHVQEIGTAQLVLARAHLEQGELEQAEDILGVGRRELRADRVGQPPGPLVDGARRARAAARATTRRRPACTAKPRRRCSRPTSRRAWHAARRPTRGVTMPRSRPPIGGRHRAADRRQMREHEPARGRDRGRNSPRKDLRHDHQGHLLRLVVSLSAFASLASLAGGFFDGH